jgi:hypothetical protein
MRANELAQFSHNAERDIMTSDDIKKEAAWCLELNTSPDENKTLLAPPDLEDRIFHAARELVLRAYDEAIQAADEEAAKYRAQVEKGNYALRGIHSAMHNMANLISYRIRSLRDELNN